MNVRPHGFPGVFVLEGEIATDERGSFSRIFDRETFEREIGAIDVRQWSYATNRAARTVRGMHYAQAPYQEAKLICVVAGAIFDVLVDVRPASPTFGAWTSIELRGDRTQTLFVPTGFAHGYQTLTDDAVVVYGISTSYVAAAARGISALDPALAIAWPHDIGVMSARDRALPSLEDAFAAERDAP